MVDVTTDIASNGSLRTTELDALVIGAGFEFPVPWHREFGCNALMLMVLSLRNSVGVPGIDEFPCIFPASREFGVQKLVRS
jgi:hypothetical protein